MACRNSYAEQLEVETHFNKSNTLETYWTGLTRSSSGTTYGWQDGTQIGVGYPSDTNPYGEGSPCQCSGAGLREYGQVLNLCEGIVLGRFARP